MCNCIPVCFALSHTFPNWSGLTENCEFRKSGNFTFAYLSLSPSLLLVNFCGKQTVLLAKRGKGGKGEPTRPLRKFPKELLLKKRRRTSRDPLFFRPIFFWGGGEEKSIKRFFFLFPFLAWVKIDKNPLLDNFPTFAPFTMERNGQPQCCYEDSYSFFSLLSVSI